MASAFKTSSGTWAVQFTAADGKRPILRLGKNARDARAIQTCIEELVFARQHGRPLSPATETWLAGIGDRLRVKLVKYGLVTGVQSVKAVVEPMPAAAALPLAATLDANLAGRTDAKRFTLNNLRQVRNALVNFFTETRDMRTITRGDANDWHRAMKVKYAKATVAAFVKKARQLFGDAVDRKLLADNPFKGIKAGSMSNPDRFHYVPPATIAKVIDQCPDARWRLIFALARFAGLRIPSELGILIADVRWDAGRILIRSPKTAHHEGRATREIPIFPQIVPYLREVFEQAEPGQRYLIDRRNPNLRTQAGRIIERAGFAQWPRMFQNLRSSCETDLSASFPIHVVCGWLGNSEIVARKHYLQTTDDHFAQAVKGDAKSEATRRGNRIVSTNQLHSLLGLADELPPAGVALQRSTARGIHIITKRHMRNAMRRLRAASPYLYQAELEKMRARGGAR